jgi:hypothetical protein
VSTPTRRVRQESGFDQAKLRLASISTTGADERDIVVVHGWLHEHGVDLIMRLASISTSARTSATWRWFMGGSTTMVST